MLVDIKFRIKVETTARLTSHICKCGDVFELLLSCRENKHVNGDLNVSQLTTCVLEVLVAGTELGRHVLLRVRLALKHRMSTYSGRSLKEHHFATHSFNDRVCRLNGSYKARIRCLCLLRIHEVIVKVVEQIQNQIVTIRQAHQQVIILAWHKNLFSVRDYEHLGSLKCASQVEEVQILVIANE